MYSRYLLAMCLVTFFAVGIYAKAEEEESAELEDRGAAAKLVGKLFAKIAAGMAANCIIEATEHCYHLWRHPSEALDCGKEFFKENKGRCAIGK